MNNKNRGKRIEAAFAKRLKAKRVGILGNEDLQHPKYSIEVKSREKHAVFRWMEQCDRNNIDSKIPLLVIHEVNKRYDDALVCMRLTDWEALQCQCETNCREG
jgi:hypothetical protein